MSEPNEEKPRDLLGEHLAEQARKKREADELKAMLVPKPIHQGAQVYAGVAPTEQQTPEMFDRWAKTYGDIITELKRSGSAKVPIEGLSVNAKTLSEHLRAIRRAIKLFHYKSPMIDNTFDMDAYSFMAVGDFVYVNRRTGKSRASVMSAAPSVLPPLLVNNRDDLVAVQRVFSLKDSNGRDFALNTVAIYLADDSLVPDLHALFKGCPIESFLGTFEIHRAVEEKLL